MVVEQVQGPGRDPPHAVAHDVGCALGDLGRVVDHRPDLEEAQDQPLLVGGNGRLERRRGEPERRVHGRQVRPPIAEHGHELAERVIGPAWRRKHLRHAVDRKPLGLDRPQHVVGRDAALAQRMGQPDPGHVDGDESALGIPHEHADGDQLVDLRGLHVRLARELRLRQVARLRSHVPIIAARAAPRALHPGRRDA